MTTASFPPKLKNGLGDYYGGKGKPESGLPKVDLHEDKGVIDSAKDKVGKFFHGLHKSEVKEEKKKEK